MAVSSSTPCPTTTTEVPMRGSVLARWETLRVSLEDASEGWPQQRWQWQSYRRSQSRRRRQVAWKCPSCRNKILARSHMHYVWMYLEPSRPRTYWTDRCSPRFRITDRISGYRNGNPKGQAVAACWSDFGLGPGATSQSEEKPGSRGGAVDGGAAKDERSKSKDGSGEQIGGRGQTAGSPRHLDLCRRRSSGTSVTSSAPATGPQCGHQRSANEDDRRANEQCNRLSTMDKRQSRQ